MSEALTVYSSHSVPLQEGGGGSGRRRSCSFYRRGETRPPLSCPVGWPRGGIHMQCGGGCCSSMQAGSEQPTARFITCSEGSLLVGPGSVCHAVSVDSSRAEVVRTFSAGSDVISKNVPKLYMLLLRSKAKFSISRRWVGGYFAVFSLCSKCVD